MSLRWFAHLVSVGNYLLLFIYVVYFLFSSFRFLFFFPRCENNCFFPIISQNPHPHTRWSNSFKPTPFQWVTTYYCLYKLLTFCFLSFYFSLLLFSPLQEQTQRRLWTKNRVSLTLHLLVILFFTIMLLFSVFNF